jgi:hypothetical protein
LGNGLGVINIADSVKNVNYNGEQAWRELIIQSIVRKPTVIDLEEEET